MGANYDYRSDTPGLQQWSGRYLGYGNFDTLRCAADFANEAFKAGYRTVKQ